MNKNEFELWINTGMCVDIQIPNEIFDDFGNADFKSFNHKCFSYAYNYLITYFYRNVHYEGNTEMYSQDNILKYLSVNKSSVSYIVKKNGLLDTMGYTKTTTNYPISIYFDEDGLLEFGLVKELRKRVSIVGMHHSPNLSIKEPVLGFVRFDDEHYTGTFYSFQNTHRVEVSKFIKIISDNKLGHVGLYIYGYLCMMCDKFKGGYQITNIELGNVVGCSERTIRSYTNRLEEVGLIKSSRRFFEGKRLHKLYTVE